MWKLFSRRRRPAVPHRALRFETLEPRYCLTAAVIESLAAQIDSTHVVSVTGRVIDESPTAVQVSLSGVVDGSVTPDADGYFSWLGQASGLGSVSAVAFDDESLYSDIATTELAASAPTVSVSASANGNGRYVDISGMVQGAVGSGTIVILTGVVQGDVAVDASGWFSITLEASALGTIDASVTDIWGQLGSGSATVASDEPTLSLSASPIDSAGYLQVTASYSGALESNSSIDLSGVGSGTLNVEVGSSSASGSIWVSGAGTLQASTTDVWGRTVSSEVYVEYEQTPPTPSMSPSISLTATSNGNGRYIDVYGTVSADDASGLSVWLGGVVSGYVTTNGDGSFYATLEATALGAVTAYVVDTWGQATESQVELAADAPSLVLSTSMISSSGSLQVAGYVTGNWSGTPTVSFSGIAAGDLTSDWGGNYYFGTLSATGFGSLVASITDVWGRVASVESYVECEATHTAPTLSLSAAVNGLGRQVSISGLVQSESPAGLTVVLGGVVSGSTTTDGSGSFSTTLEASSLGTITASVTDAWGQTTETSVEIDAEPPSIVLTSSMIAADGSIQVAGYLQGNWDGQPLVNFSGIAGGQLSATWAGNYFFGTLSASSAGTLIASATDIWGRTTYSEVAVEYEPVVTMPTLSFTATPTGEGRLVQISGYAQGENVGGINVGFGGVATASVWTDANGYFSLTVEATSLGTVYGSFVDCYGQMASASAEVQSAAPQITTFAIVEVGSGEFVISGLVVDDSPSGVVITLGGTLTGVTLTPDQSGHFAFSQFAEYHCGDHFTVDAVDVWGMQSSTFHFDMA